MTDNEVNVLKTDVALIKKDIKQIERVFDKVDDAIGDMTEIHKIVAVQEKILENTDRRIENLEESFIKHADEEAEYRKELSKTIADMREDAQIQRERRHKEVLRSIGDLNKSLSEKLSRQDARIQALENWRWYILGIGAVLLFILNQLPWSSFFG